MSGKRGGGNPLSANGERESRRFNNANINTDNQREKTCKKTRTFTSNNRLNRGFRKYPEKAGVFTSVADPVHFFPDPDPRIRF